MGDHKNHRDDCSRRSAATDRRAVALANVARAVRYFVGVAGVPDMTAATVREVFDRLAGQDVEGIVIIAPLSVTAGAGWRAELREAGVAVPSAGTSRRCSSPTINDSGSATRLP
jgi:hypothetical protein